MQEPDHLRQAPERLKREAAELKFEVLTPAAAAELFGKSMPTVREAARDERIETVFTVRFSGKAVRLYRLESCIDYWRKPDPEKLKRFRENGHVLFVGNEDGQAGISYNVLHAEPLITLEAAADPD